ncbi:putative LRR receptor-like serine/threonine-protein kinase [Nymphaea thermarum]|nr:putative LRR receptor-like serine/threonine-protein kinase [Nymphaea thermarum]
MAKEKSFYPVLFLFLLSTLMLQERTTRAQHPLLQAQGRALLKWRDSLHVSDQHPSVLNSYWPSSLLPNSTSNITTDPCHWFGIICDHHARSIVEINLPNASIEGTLGFFDFSTLSTLTALNLSANNLSGSIPDGISSLSKLSLLDLSKNLLFGNMPHSMANITSISDLRIGDNRINGQLLPNFFINWKNLSVLYLGGNMITGAIPVEIRELKNVQKLDLSRNFLTGTLPASIGELSHLRSLQLYNNNLTGMIPAAIGNLKALSDLELDFNDFTGQIPSSIGNLSSLVGLYLTNNNLVGPIPLEIGNLKNLIQLEVGMNSLNGVIPSIIGNLSKIRTLSLYKNHLTGIIPSEIGNLKNLTGPMPSSLKNCKSLVRVRLERNNINDNISNAFGTHPNLKYLAVNKNALFGELSLDWKSYSKLEHLDLSENHITGRIPPSISGMGQRLDLSMNILSGSIPQELGSCTDLILLKLNANNLTGEIPLEIGNLVNLQELLDLSKNALNGSIPEQFQKLKMLEYLNLSHNELTGGVPSSLVEMKSLSVVDISYNDLEGPLPDSKVFSEAKPNAFIGNSHLCGEPNQGLPPCNISTSKYGVSKKTFLVIIAFTIVITSVLLVSIAIYGIYYKFCMNINKMASIRTNHGDNLFSVWGYDGKVVYDDIINASENFNKKYCIGNGRHGSVYRIMLPTGQVVAVKRFDKPEESFDEKSFVNEVQSLTEIRHRNIVKLYGFCWHVKDTFLVYEYMEKGNLKDMLSDNKKAVELDWAKRIRLLKGLAEALSYMHHSHATPMKI